MESPTVKFGFTRFRAYSTLSGYVKKVLNKTNPLILPVWLPAKDMLILSKYFWCKKINKVFGNYNINKMQDILNEAIDLKLKELHADLKIDPNDPDWQSITHQKLTNTLIIHRIFLSVGLIILVSSSVLMFITLFFEGNTWYGIEFNRQLFYLLFTVNFCALVFTMTVSLDRKSVV